MDDGTITAISHPSSVIYFPGRSFDLERSFIGSCGGLIGVPSKRTLVPSHCMIGSLDIHNNHSMRIYITERAGRMNLLSVEEIGLIDLKFSGPPAGSVGPIPLINIC